MAARLLLLLLRRAFPSSLFPRASRPPPTFSTAAAGYHTTLLRSLTEGNIKGQVTLPRLPIPDGFPFILTRQGDKTLSFLRQDEDGQFEVVFDLESPKIINGDRCFDARASVMRGDWMVDFDVVAGSKTLLVKEVNISQYYKRNLPGFEQYVESKGITKGMVQGLLSLAKNKDGKIDCLERRPGEEATPFFGPFQEILNQAANEMQPRRE